MIDWRGLVLIITAIIGIFALIGILYDGWSSLKNAGTNSDLKSEIKKDLVRNLIFGAIIFSLIIIVESTIFYTLF